MQDEAVIPAPARLDRKELKLLLREFIAGHNEFDRAWRQAGEGFNQSRRSGDELKFVLPKNPHDTGALECVLTAYQQQAALSFLAVLGWDGVRSRRLIGLHRAAREWWLTGYSIHHRKTYGTAVCGGAVRAYLHNQIQVRQPRS
jgi:hypothetical protein